MYNPFIIKLPKVDIKHLELSDSKDNIVLSPIMSYPLFSLGFHSFVNRTRNAMNITKNLPSKNEFYYVVNPFEVNISNFEDDLQKSTKLYLKNKDDLSHDFYKIWESLFVLDVANQKELSSLILSSNDSNIENIVQLYREKTGLNNKKDIIKKLTKDTKKNSMNFIIGDDNIQFTHEANNEIDTYDMMVDKLINILKHQENGGNCLLKIYDTYTFTTIKLIYILSAFYEEVYIYKPFMSRPTISEKYLVLKNFKINKELDKTIKSLETIKNRTNTKDYIIDIYPDIVIPKDFLNIFRFSNIRLNNQQQIMINDIIVYIKENNYFGDKYHMYRDNQIEATKWWIYNFFPPSENIYKKNKEDLGKIYKSTQERLNLESQKLIESLN